MILNEQQYIRTVMCMKRYPTYFFLVLRNYKNIFQDFKFLDLTCPLQRKCFPFLYWAWLW